MTSERSKEPDKLDDVVAQARRAQDERARGYRERALAMYPWVCGRCGREFDRANVKELTVHHKDGDHDNNPADGSNWELLCIYCHENEHSRYEDHLAADGSSLGDSVQDDSSHRPFAGLKDLLGRDD
jgi:hypothetical protein